MSASLPSLSVWVADDFACVKITGRAGCPGSVDFKRLLLGLREKGHARFVLDLTDCVLMDSTFLGVLAWMVLHFDKPADGLPRARIELLNANTRITELLDNLGVAHLFSMITGPTLAPGRLEPVQPETPDRAEISRTSLEAHELLCRLNPGNTPKFKEVCRYLEEDLKKLEKKNGHANGHPNGAGDKH